MPVLEGIGEKKDSQGGNCLAEDFFLFWHWQTAGHYYNQSLDIYIYIYMDLHKVDVAKLTIHIDFMGQVSI